MDFDDFEDEDDDDESDPIADKQKRQKRFTNKSRRDKQNGDKQPYREKSTSKVYRPRYSYDPDYDNEWDEDYEV